MEKTIKNRHNVTINMFDDAKHNLEMESIITFNEKEIINIGYDLFVDGKPVDKKEFLKQADLPRFNMESVLYKTAFDVREVVRQNPELNRNILQKLFDSLPTINEMREMLDMNDDVTFNINKEDWRKYWHTDEEPESIKVETWYTHDTKFILSKHSGWESRQNDVTLDVVPSIYWFTNVKSICGQSLFGEGFVRLLTIDGKVVNVAISVRFKDINNPNNDKPNVDMQEDDWPWEEYYNTTYDAIHHAQWVLPRGNVMEFNIDEFDTKEKILSAIQKFYGSWVARNSINLDLAQQLLQKVQEDNTKAKQLFEKDFEQFNTIAKKLIEEKNDIHSYNFDWIKIPMPKEEEYNDRDTYWAEYGSLYDMNSRNNDGDDECEEEEYNKDEA